jgi:Heme/copper-type cytochrome/quinol oxidases, subunit 2
MGYTDDSRYEFCQAREGLAHRLKSWSHLSNNLYLGVLALTAFFALIVIVFVVYFAIRYRHETAEKVGAPITGWMPLEIGWSLIPFFVSVSILVWASMALFHVALQNTSPK